MVDWKKAKHFFFKAMINGWAGNAEKITLPQMPGYKVISFSEEDLYLTDCYCVTPDSTSSVGTTTIYYEDNPIWIMQYGGYYRKEAIGFLKEVLLSSYENRDFIGGRGPYQQKNHDLIYTNNPSTNRFHDFKGEENIHNQTYNIKMGYHHYWGMSF
ncbi:MAG: DUF5680 domain-containing protein [Parcubacteria group bacterium]|jgi:hypothetical protein